MSGRALAALIAVLAPFPATAARLPLAVVPSHYRIVLTPDLEREVFAGEETITVAVKRPAKSITLHALEIEFDEVTIEAGGSKQTAAVSLDSKEQTATLAVTNEIPAGPATIAIRYRGKLNDKLRGFYISRTDRRKYAATQFEPTDARRAFPSFDEPAMKATFDLAVVVDEGDTAISNAPVVDDRPGPGEGKHTITFGTTAKMSTYLVALLVGDFECIEGGADGIPIRVCAVPEKKHLGRYGLATAEAALTHFNRYYGVPYPFGKLDVIAVPDFEAGAMENTGAVTFRETSLLIDEKEAGVGNRKGIAATMAHEIAHMWFGDLVTMKWWNDIWLNEGFATWATAGSLKAWKPEWNIDLDETQATSGSLAVDSLESTRPIRARAETPAEINEMFDGIAYGKTAAVLRMLESYVGEEAFRDGIRAYIRKYSYSNAAAEDFWNTMAAATKKPVDRIMKSFVDQPGAPLISASARCEGGSTLLTLTQKRIFSDRKRFLAGSNQTWTVPVMIRDLDDSGGGGRGVLLTKAAETFRLPGCTPHLFLNRSGRGFYRSAHAPEMLQTAKSLDAALTPAERITLLNDNWALVRLGEKEIAEQMALLDRFRGERNRAVLDVILGQFAGVESTLVGEEAREPFRAWLRDWLRPLAAELGWDPAPGESDEQKQLRASVLGTLGGAAMDEATLARARDLASKAIDEPSAVDGSLLDTVFHLASLSGDEAWFDTLKEHLPKAKTPHEYYRYLYSLTAFRQPELHARALELALSPAMRNQDLPRFLGAMLGNRYARETTWEFIKRNWAQLETRFTTWGGAGVVGATGVFCDDRKREDVKSFFAEHPVPAVDRGLKQSLERIESCAAFRALQSANFDRWIGKTAVPPSAQ
ncbi:MAG TPA: M1 family metallopeptidase [Thermoanaerobaculia bacterium]|nr:M1 family metallopeptidase [Thermoanaerobaculia bacterium]